MKRAMNDKSSKRITFNVGNRRVKIYCRSRVVRGIAYQQFAVADYSSGSTYRTGIPETHRSGNVPNGIKPPSCLIQYAHHHEVTRVHIQCELDLLIHRFSGRGGTDDGRSAGLSDRTFLFFMALMDLQTFALPVHHLSCHPPGFSSFAILTIGIQPARAGITDYTDYANYQAATDNMTAIWMRLVPPQRGGPTACSWC